MVHACRRCLQQQHCTAGVEEQDRPLKDPPPPVNPYRCNVCGGGDIPGTKLPPVDMYMVYSLPFYGDASPVVIYSPFVSKSTVYSRVQMQSD